MKLGDIKIEALKLMFTNYSFDMSIENLTGKDEDIDKIPSLYGNETYGSYLVNMGGSISRALDRIENACVLPQKIKEITREDVSDSLGKSFLRYDTKKINDLFMIDRVSATYPYGEYDGNVDYYFEGDNILLKNSLANYTIIYYPKCPEIANLLDNDELNVPDKIARLIPYYIKSDLYQEEEPRLAADARNLFEASLDDLKKQSQNRQNYVDNNYKMW